MQEDINLLWSTTTVVKLGRHQVSEASSRYGYQTSNKSFGCAVAAKSIFDSCFWPPVCKRQEEIATRNWNWTEMNLILANSEVVNLWFDSQEHLRISTGVESVAWTAAAKFDDVLHSWFTVLYGIQKYSHSRHTVPSARKTQGAEFESGTYPMQCIASVDYWFKSFLLCGVWVLMNMSLLSMYAVLITLHVCNILRDKRLKTT